MPDAQPIELGRFYDLITSYEYPHVFNPWRDWDQLDSDWAPFSAQQRLARLKLHFSCLPKFILIGEAPGYQGCHFTGVPFTSESLLMRDVIPRIKTNGKRITQRERPWSEPSATIVWRTLFDLGIAENTIMWNAFPFHPHEPGNLHSNRTPKKHELDSAKDATRILCISAPQATLIPVGNKAKETLKSLGISYDVSVRHPSMGGARAFADGMMRALMTRP